MTGVRGMAGGARDDMTSFMDSRLRGNDVAVDAGMTGLLTGHPPSPLARSEGEYEHPPSPLARSEGGFAPLPSPLASGFRRNDVVVQRTRRGRFLASLGMTGGARNDRGVSRAPLWIPAFAGMTGLLTLE